MFRSAICLLSIVLSLAACSRDTPHAAEKPTPVRIATATRGPAALSIAASGVLANKDELQLSFKVGGVIKSIKVDAGAGVKRGQLLAELEPIEIDAQVEQARQLADKAQREFERGERLYADQVIALEQLESLRTQLKVAQAQLQAAQFNERHAAINAPSDGIVLRKLAQEHEIIAPGQPVLRMGSQARGFIVRAALSDRDVAQLRVGDAVEVKVDALPDQTLQARVTEIGKAALTPSGLFSVEAAIADAPPTLNSGLVARLTIQPAAARQSELVHVPISAIVEGDKRKASVFVLDNDRALRREVEVAFIAADDVALRNGLNAGERVVVGGALYLSDGEHVAVATAEASQ